MKQKTLICSVICLICVWLALPPVQAWHPSEYKATIYAPAEVRLDKTKIVPITVEVTTPEGLQYFSELDGPIELWAHYGQFVKSDGTVSPSPFSVEVVKGRVEAVLSLEQMDSVPYSLGISVTRGEGDHEVLGQAVVGIRYPEHITISVPISSVVANGASQPVIVATIEDQFGQPMENVDVTARFRCPEGKVTLVGNSDATGDARVELPASRKAGYAIGQVITERLASPMVTILYNENHLALMPLRDVASQIKATVHWNSKSRVAIVVTQDLRLEVQEGETIARMNGSPIPLGTVAYIRDGRIQVPIRFVREIVGLKV